MNTMRFSVVALTALGLTVSAQAHWSWFKHWDWHHGWKHEDNLKGSHCKGSHWKGSIFKGSHCKGSIFKGSHCKGSIFKGSHCKGSKGSGHKETGNLKGLLFEDTNGNGQYDEHTDRTLRDVRIVVTDQNGNTYETYTKKSGKFKFKHIPAGDVTVDIDDTTLPQGDILVIGEDPQEVVVKADETISIGYIGYQSPDMVGEVYGYVFNDANYNEKYDQGEVGQEGIEVRLTDTYGKVHTTYTDAQGRYLFTDIPAGTATVEIVSLPQDTELKIGENPNEVEVEPNTDNFAGIDGYQVIDGYPLSYGQVSGFLFEDRDSNGVFDAAYDQPISNVTVGILAADGKEYNVTTGPDGHYLATSIPAGDATVKVYDDAIKSAHPDAVQTAGTNPTPIVVEANGKTDAGIDSYNYRDGGLITGMLFKDENADGVYDAGVDTPMENIAITHTANGHDYIATTDADGVWYAYVKESNGTTVNVSADINQILNTYGSNLQITTGNSSQDVTLEVGKKVSTSAIGYGVKDVVPF